MSKHELQVFLTIVGFFLSSLAPAFGAESTKFESIDSLQREADQEFWKRNYPQAGQKIAKLLELVSSQEPLRARCLVNAAICDMEQEDLVAAKKHSDLALKVAMPDSMMEADALLVRAQCLYLAGKTSGAEKVYIKAIAIAEKNLGQWNVDTSSFYEGLAACALHRGDWVEAERAYKKVAQLDLLKYGSESTQLGWGLLSLRSVEARLNHHAIERELYKKVFWNFRHQNEVRIMNEHKNATNQEQLKNVLREQLYGSTGAYGNESLGLSFIKDGIPSEAYSHPQSREQNFGNWTRQRIGRERAPGLAFFDPTKNLRALIIAVHGLGLYHGAFTPFAQQIQHEGLGVVCFDVRGFGSYRNDEVYHRLDLPGAISDLTRILTELKEDYPDTPMILLGESMGGAIVLRLAATAPNLVDAVISSVPSGSRYHSKATAFGVGLKLISDKNKVFNFGKQIVEQATKKADLRDMWEGDPNVRMNFSASELLNFQHFMSENVEYAQQIKTTPVIIFQGYSDNLVKPMGTLAIYQAIQNKDKDLLFIGKAEHLIFEEGQFDPDVYKGVVAWINNHLQRRDNH